MIITLKRDATCSECGARLRPGTRARWYKSGQTYGLDCHARSAPARRTRTPSYLRPERYARRDLTAYEQGDTSPGAIASHYDRQGVYAIDGTKLGSSCGCIDYPCCGH